MHAVASSEAVPFVHSPLSVFVGPVLFVRTQGPPWAPGIAGRPRDDRPSGASMSRGDFYREGGSPLERSSSRSRDEREVASESLRRPARRRRQPSPKECRAGVESSGGLSPSCVSVTWLILPVVICLSQRLSHACLSMNASYCETANGSLNQL